MATLFSKRNKFDPRVPKAPIVEEAPKILRLGYWRQILEPRTYIDKDTRYERADTEILGRKQLLEDLCLAIHSEPNTNMQDSWFCTDELQEMVMGSPWFSFYDVVECVGRKLLDENADLFASYRDDVNQLFEDNLVVWKLDNNGSLLRTGIEDLQKKTEEVSDILQAGFPNALHHLIKAKRFLTARPLDPENAIKEAVSTVESYGRTLYPKAATLGDVIKELRKTPFPALILSMMEKFYAFASAEPGVRHGSSVSSQIGLADADFCLYVSVAFIDYLHKLQNK